MSPALATSKAPLHPRCAESIDYGLDASPEEEEGDLAELAVRHCWVQAARVTWRGLAHKADPPASSTSRQPVLMCRQGCMPGCAILLRPKTLGTCMRSPTCAGGCAAAAPRLRPRAGREGAEDGGEGGIHFCCFLGVDGVSKRELWGPHAGREHAQHAGEASSGCDWSCSQRCVCWPHQQQCPRRSNLDSPFPAPCSARRCCWCCRPSEQRRSS